MLNKKQTSSKNKKYVFIAVALLVIAGVSVFGWKQTHKQQIALTNTTSDQNSTTKLDLTPATPADKEDSNSHKTTDPDPQPSTETNKVAVTPVIVDASQYGQQVEVRSYVTGIVESAGTCNFTFTHGSTTFKKQNTATADATTTKCPNLTLDSTSFAVKGTWSVVVSYDSLKASGSSGPMNFEVK